MNEVLKKIKLTIEAMKEEGAEKLRLKEGKKMS